MIQVDSMTIEDVMLLTGVDRIDLLKMDIEGAEKSLFEEDKNDWINSVNNIVIELHDNAIEGCTESFEKMMSQFTFDKYDTTFNSIRTNIMKR